jgi:hypothetical protein
MRYRDCKSWQDFGEYFGYPPCCVAAFPNESVRLGPWVGTGFLACKECASEASKDFGKFIQEKIKPHRSCREPFPHGGRHILSRTS